MFKTATYVSPKNQNEIIHIIGKYLIQARLVKEIKNDKLNFLPSWLMMLHHTMLNRWLCV